MQKCEVDGLSSLFKLFVFVWKQVAPKISKPGNARPDMQIMLPAYSIVALELGLTSQTDTQEIINPVSDVNSVGAELMVALG